MSGQIVLVSEEERIVHVSYPDHSFICANFECNNILTDFELTKISQMGNNTRVRCRWNYCRKCRRSRGSSIDKIRCNKCGIGFYISAGRSDTAKLCTLCKRDNHDIKLKQCQSVISKAILEERPDRFCRVCGKKTDKRKLDCSKKCSYKWHAMARRKTNEALIQEIKENRFCAYQECHGPISPDADFRARYCSPDCKRLHQNLVVKAYRKKQKEINNQKVMI